MHDDRGLGRKPQRRSAILLAVGLALLLPGRMSLPPLDRDESRYLEASRQMLATGNLIDIRFQDRPRYLQPAGIYWLESAAAATTRALTGTPGVVDQAWPYRIPSLLAGLANILLTASIGTLLLGPAAGTIGALLFAASVLAVAEAHMATIDTTLLCAILVAMRALATLWLARIRSRTPGLIFWAAIGCGLMLKGPVVLIPTLGTLAVLCAVARSADPLRRTRPATGLLVALAIVLPWSIGIWHVSHGTFFSNAVGHNLIGKISSGRESHGAPPGSYLAMFPLAFWPGSIFAALAIPTVWSRRREPAIAFLLAWAATQWIVFEAIATKLPHYVLPAYPAIALLAAAALLAPAPFATRLLARAAIAIWLVLGLVIAAAGPALLIVLGSGPTPSSLIAAFVGALLVAAATVLLFQNRRPQAAIAALAAAAVLYAGLFLAVIPALDPIWLSPRIAQAVRLVRPCPQSPLAVASYSEPSLIFATGRDTLLTTPEGAAAFLPAHPACGLAMVDRRDLPRFQAALGTTKARQLAEIDGIDTTNGRHQHLLVFRPEPAR